MNGCWMDWSRGSLTDESDPGRERGTRRAALGDWGERVPEKPLKPHGLPPGGVSYEDCSGARAGEGGGTAVGPGELQKPGI